MKDDLAWEARNERIKLKENLIKWGVVPPHDPLPTYSTSSSYLVKLFGYDGDYETWWCEESIKPKVYKQLCLLNGPNGYTIFKAMEARRG